MLATPPTLAGHHARQTEDDFRGDSSQSFGVDTAVEVWLMLGA